MRSAIEMGRSVPSAPARASLGAWIQAIRPKTLIVSVVPVMVGTALAYNRGHLHIAGAVAALLGALLIQIGTNLINDYYDFKKGADTAARTGPVRLTQSGLVSPSRVLSAGVLSFALAMVFGAYLAILAGWPIVVIGVFSLAAGYAYTGGPFPLGYHGLGDLFVFVFFGLVAVAGTYYVQSGAIEEAVWFGAVPVGAIATAVLVVNNLRDIATDAQVGKRTMAVRLGARVTLLEYLALLAAAFLAPGLLWATHRAGSWVLLAYGALPFAFPPLRRVIPLSLWERGTGEGKMAEDDRISLTPTLSQRERGQSLNKALGETARLLLAFGLLFSLGLILSRGGIP
jgi:1,4-dihydroxy-2-naphthoate polyprenyltransferase